MAQVDMFLKIDGVTGESQDSKHAGEIEILTWNWGATNAGSFSHGGGGGAGKVQMSDFSITKRVDKASPVLFEKCASGDHIKTAVLTARKAGKDQQEYLIISFTDLLVSSTNWSGQSADATMAVSESVSLNFSSISIDYKEQKADGTLGPATKKGWDVTKNKAV